MPRLKNGRKRRSTAGSTPHKKRTKVEQLPPLLRLPTELRLHIYSYLLPNVPIIPATYEPKGMSDTLARPDYDYQPLHDPWEEEWGPGTVGYADDVPWALRSDGDLCWMDIMRVNKQIHAETTDVLYGSVAMEIEVSVAGFRYLNTGILTSRREHDVHPCRCVHPHVHRFLRSASHGDLNDLVFSISHFQKLYVTIIPEVDNIDSRFGHQGAVIDSDRVDAPNRVFKEHLNWLAHRIKQETCQNRPPLHLTLSYRPCNMNDTCLENALKWHLRPFKCIRGLTHAEIIRHTLPPAYYSPYFAEDSDSSSDGDLSSNATDSSDSEDETPEERAAAELIERKRQQALSRINKMFKKLAADMCGSKPIAEAEPLVNTWDTLYFWMDRTSLFTAPCSNNQRKQANKLALDAWTAYDVGNALDFSDAVEDLQAWYKELVKMRERELDLVKFLAEEDRDIQRESRMSNGMNLRSSLSSRTKRASEGSSED